MDAEEKLHLLLYIYVQVQRYGRYQQGSTNWLKNRIKHIGCSELGKLLNPTIATKKALILSKTGVNKLRDNLPDLMWGHAFECTTKSFTEIFFCSTVIECCGSIPHDKYRVSCSPDGIGYAKIPRRMLKNLTVEVPYSKLKIVRNNPDFTPVIEFYDFDTLYEELKSSSVDMPILPVLFEFKSPASRRLNDKVPSEYICQVQGGLEVMKIASLGIYTECRFVNCTHDEFGFNDKYRNFRGKLDDCEFMGVIPKMIGVKFFIMKPHAMKYFEEEEMIGNTFITSSADYRFGDIVSFGEDYYTFDLIFVNDPIINAKMFLEFVEVLRDLKYDIDENTLLKLYSDVLITPSSIMKIVEIVTENKFIFGTQLWKLMDFRAAYIKRVTGFLDKFNDDIEDVLGAITKLNGNDTDYIERVVKSIPSVRNKNINISSKIN
jgi:hypothetical protein